MAPMPSTVELVRAINRLRRAEANASADNQPDIADARAVLERLVGSTLRQATVAKLFGVTRAALLPWMENGELASVTTPGGTREIPLSEVLALLDDLDRARANGASRPLAQVLRARRRAAEQAFDINRLLPRRAGRGHRVADRHSLAYHRLVAERLDQPMLADARRRVARWRTDGRLHEHWLDEWERLLSQPAARVAARISADTAEARELRQSSPFAGVLNEQERQALHRAVEAREA